ALGGSRIDHVAEADPHVEDLERLAVVDLGVALDEGKDGMRVDERVELEADRRADASQRPLLWMPLLLTPMTTPPSRTARPSITLSMSTRPTAMPTMSKCLTSP